MALVGISAVGSVLSFAVDSPAVQNAVCIASCAAVAGVIIHHLYRARDVVDAALHLAEEMARLGQERPDASVRDRSHLAVVRTLPGQRAAVGQGAETPWYEDHP